MNDYNMQCPICKNHDQVYKVSRIYLAGLESFRSNGSQENNLFNNLFQDDIRYSGRVTKQALLNRFAPPSGKKSMTRSPHPDAIFVATFMFSLYILYKIYTQQPTLFSLALIIFFIVVGSYGIGRKRIIAKYLHNQEFEKREKEKTANAIESWMRLYYCPKDDCVFDPQQTIPFPLKEK